MRPSNLPEFAAPPLHEVALSVQFSAPTAYLQINAGEVWRLFRDEYPRVEEYPPLPPAFETFGPNILGFASNQVAFVGGPLHDRYWFLREQGDELVQFQQDRLVHNWRKLEDGSNAYPRFDSMIEKFQSELEKLEEFFSSLAPQSLVINQCEAIYINHFQLDAGSDFKLSDWLRFVKFEKKEPQNFSFAFRETLSDAESGQPRARLTCEVSEGLKQGNQRVVVMSLTVRGAPRAPDRASAINFLKEAREVIVTRFTEFTTDTAHKKWGRIK